MIMRQMVTNMLLTPFLYSISVKLLQKWKSCQLLQPRTLIMRTTMMNMRKIGHIRDHEASLKKMMMIYFQLQNNNNDDHEKKINVSVILKTLMLMLVI